jgi:ferritin-like metal-binding protein YciE
MRPLEKLFWEEMAEMVHIKEMLLKALLRMDTAATNVAFKKALGTYRAEVQKQSDKLRKIFQALEVSAREKKCDGMMGVLLKGQQMIQRVGQGPALDAALLAICRKVTGYNLASYASLVSWGKAIVEGENQTVAALKELLRIEMEADLRFSRLAAECDREAATQNTDSARRASAPPRKPAGELAESARYAQW